MVVGRGPVISGTRMVGSKKSLGQHWLKNRAILDEIADLAYGNGGVQVCLEIGPGLGTLTASLLKRFDRVLAVEYDDRLAENLPKSFPGTNLEVIHGDILEYDFNEVTSPYVVVGNIPYYITSPIIEKVLTARNIPERVVLLMQKEVAERILSDKESVLSLFVKNRAKVSAGPVVLAREFTPPPKVDSEVLVMEPFASGPKYPDELFKLIKVAFLAPRKKLIHNLSGVRSKDELTQRFKELDIDLNARPADLHLDKYYDIFGKLY